VQTGQDMLQPTFPTGNGVPSLNSVEIAVKATILPDLAGTPMRTESIPDAMPLAGRKSRGVMADPGASTISVDAALSASTPFGRSL